MGKAEKPRSAALSKRVSSPQTTPKRSSFILYGTEVALFDTCLAWCMVVS